MTTINLTTITRQYVGQALRAMRQDCQYNSREITAINKAALNLEACIWQYDGERLIIDSATQLHKRYHVDAHGCDCQAAAHGRPCWHLAAWHLIQRAAQVALTPPRPRRSAAEYARILAEAAELA